MIQWLLSVLVQCVCCPLCGLQSNWHYVALQETKPNQIELNWTEPNRSELNAKAQATHPSRRRTTQSSFSMQSELEKASVLRRHATQKASQWYESATWDRHTDKVLVKLKLTARRTIICSCKPGPSHSLAIKEIFLQNIRLSLFKQT